jgi:phosphatidylserine/phosphatidylglycerophosphate/cardiolipin synthase-like enzyme
MTGRGILKQYRKLFLGLGVCLVFASCARLGGWDRKCMYGKCQDLHITEEIEYPDSPFGVLVNEVFSNQDSRSDGSHYINILDVGDDALSSRIHLIRAAKKAIYIQTFIWTDDESGRFVAYELIEAAKRGVKVKIIVDQWRKMNDLSLVAFMATAHPNLEVKNYNPNARQINSSALRFIGELAFKFRQVNQRMHNKTFIIDDRIAITGGRNYENDYYDRGVTRNFKDRDVIVTGPVVRDMTDSFMQYWSFKLSVPSQDLIDVGNLIKRNKFKKFETKQSFEVGNLFDDLDSLSSDNEYIKKTFIDKAFLVKKVKFIADLPGKNNSLGLAGGGVAGVVLSQILYKAKESIIAQTPYLVLDRMAVGIVKKLRNNNPDLDIMISSNSLAATDSIYAYAFSYKQKKMFVKNLKFRIFELKPVPADISKMMPRYLLQDNVSLDNEKGWPAHGVLEEDDFLEEHNKKHICIHAKTFVIDNEISWVGSFNVDPRSTHLNTEVGLIVWDREVATALKDNILRDMAPQNSWTIGKRKEIPVISLFSGILANTLQWVPFVDIWPFRYTSSFELKDGKETVPFYHKDFYENYISVGSFPQVSLSLKEVQIRLLKMFGGIVTPIV